MTYAVGIAAAPAVNGRTDADRRLATLYEAEWAWRMQEFADPDDDMTARGSYLPHVDAATQSQRARYWQGTLAALEKIPVTQLSPEERINAGVFRAVLQAFIAQQKYREYEQPARSGDAFWLSLAPRAGFGTVEEYRAYLGRMRDIPRYFSEQTDNMRAGLARHFTPPREAILGREATISAFLSKDSDRNPFWLPFAQMPVAISAADREALQAQARLLITGTVAPAYAKLLPFVRDVYIPGARTAVAAESLPDGKAYYRSKIREYATVDLAPEAIHAIGLQEVERINTDMLATIRSSGWKGDFAGFVQFLRTDPQFYAKTPQELVAFATAVANRVNGQLRFNFGRLPRYRYTILPTPDAIAAFATGGSGGLDSCLINTSRLESRPLYTIPPLVAHECAPGHSFQAALALEQEDRPAFRRNTYFSGYGEGWGLYSEWLGTGMGLYRTPYEVFGRETYEMWRAARLVVDTGLHHFGWTRDQAIDYLMSHTALSRHEIAGEVDRYISWPGQAVAYKLGEMLIRRKHAEVGARLGPEHLRWYNDMILKLGAVPLPVLEQAVDEWVAAGGPDPYR